MTHEGWHTIKEINQTKPMWREKFTFIPKWDFIFARVKIGQAGTWSLVE